MYEDVLIPTDGSEAAAAALDHAIELAKRYDARLHTLYVVDAAAYETVAESGAFATHETGPEIIVEALEDAGQAATERIESAAADENLDVVAEVRQGTPEDDILAYADERDIDLVVMGTHGRDGLDRVLLGSVTERVVRNSSVPVLTVRADGE